MKNVQKIRFIAANYGALQGLRMLPFNLLALWVSWWANQVGGRSGDLTLPVLMFVLSCLFYLGIDQYYKRTFGQVKQKTRESTMDAAIGITWGFLSLAAFGIDTGLNLPFSTLGLVFALGLGVEYARLTLRAHGPYARYYLLLAALMAAISLLPLTGSGAWWQAIGFHTPVLAILAVIGLFGILAGLISHYYLLRALRSAGEAPDGTTV
jgi:hypothetical protein